MNATSRIAALLLLVLPLASRAERAEIPVDFGIGPAAYYFFGLPYENRGPIPHFGLKLNLYAVIDRDLINRHKNRVPPQYRKMAGSVTEVRITPSLLIPDALILSPKVDSLGGTGIYGITWRPLSLGMPLVGNPQSRVRLDLRAGLLLTYAYLYSDFLPTTHFARPGADLMLEMELMASRQFLVSLGWASQLYVPQKLGSFGFGTLEESIFHVGQAFLKLHFRFPYRTNI